MTEINDRLVMLDTSVVVHIARNDATGRAMINDYALDTRPERPLLSSVAQGELLGLARIWGWGQRKLDLLDDWFRELVIVSAGLPPIVHAYGEMSAWARTNGLAVGQDTQQNDLWIAASAKVADAVLITNDHDFDALDPLQITRIYVAPV